MLSIQMHTCQLSFIMRECHACGLKTLISRIKDNISRLTHKPGLVVFEHMINNKIQLNFPKKELYFDFVCVRTLSQHAKIFVFQFAIWI